MVVLPSSAVILKLDTSVLEPVPSGFAFVVFFSIEESESGPFIVFPSYVFDEVPWNVYERLARLYAVSIYPATVSD